MNADRLAGQSYKALRVLRLFPVLILFLSPQANEPFDIRKRTLGMLRRLGIVKDHKVKSTAWTEEAIGQPLGGEKPVPVATLVGGDGIAARGNL